MPKDSQTPTVNTHAARWRIFAFIIIILIIGFAAVWLITRRSGPSTPRPYQQKYSRLTQYKLAGPVPGAGAKFDTPFEFNSSTVSNSPGATSQVSFIQRPASLASASTGLGQIILLSYKDPSIGSAAAFGREITSTSESGHWLAVNRLAGFVDTRLPGYQPAVLAKPSALSTPNLKDNAWTAEFSAAPKPPAAGSKIQLPALKGQAAIIISSHSTYYLMIDAVDYNWTANGQVWQKVINSLEIDQ